MHETTLNDTYFLGLKMSFMSDFTGENIVFFHLDLNKVLQIFAYNITFKMRRRIIRKNYVPQKYRL